MFKNSQIKIKQTKKTTTTKKKQNHNPYLTQIFYFYFLRKNATLKGNLNLQLHPFFFFWSSDKILPYSIKSEPQGLGIFFFL